MMVRVDEPRTLTLTEFLTARLDEDEAWAKEALALSSIYDQQSLTWHWIAAHSDGSRWMTTSHDPARVLAEVEAKRLILKFHESWPVLVQTQPELESVVTDPSSMTMRVSQQIAWATEREYRAKFGDEPPTSAILCALALPYADHPDFRHEWRP